MATCKQCGEEKNNLGNHWNLSYDCEYPQINNKQLGILTGILIGDGCLDRSGSNPRIKIEMVNQEYLNYVDDVLGNLSNGVKLIQTAKDSAKRMRDSGFRPNADESDYSPVYKLTTKRHPKLSDFESWYSSGEKVVPKMELTPTILKHWYVCDGHLVEQENCRPSVVFAITNEYNRSDKLEQMFIEKCIDANATKSKNLRIGVDHTEKFFQFVGEPVNGFKYKWP